MNAPYHKEIAHGPDQASALWTETSDGIRLRVALWPAQSANGTVFIFPGRTEYVEKYGHVARFFVENGLNAAAIDWRGQGLADRLMDNPLRGHVDDFADYQKDVEAFYKAVKDAGFQGPYYLLAHSMGGAIGLRALHDGFDVKAAAFSAPMWGIKMSMALRPVAWLGSRVAAAIGQGSTLAPGTLERSFILQDPFENNTLTRDEAMWNRMVTQLKTVPDLELGGPSLDWVRLAVVECNVLHKMPSPLLPCLTLLGSNERIVDTARIHHRMTHWKGGSLTMVPGAEHEVLMEGPDVRDPLLQSIFSHFSGAV